MRVRCSQGKKKFDKKNAQHFWVLHRSQTDETRHIVDGQVSEHVLVPVEVRLLQ